MTKERELLRRALEVLDEKVIGYDITKGAIRTYLSTTSDDAEEPVAWMFQHEDTGLIDFVDTQQVEWGFEKNNPRWQKFGPVFLHPPKPAEPARKPMTEEEIDEAIGGIGNLCVFKAGIRFAEKHHGIGGSDDKQS